jgi:hypothetical protein
MQSHYYYYLDLLLLLLPCFVLVDQLNVGATIVTLECAAVLPNSEADDVVKHIEAVWERGKLAIDALRASLIPELRDVLCPLRNGGVSLHKLYGVMHDTCNCANKVRA